MVGETTDDAEYDYPSISNAEVNSNVGYTQIPVLDDIINFYESSSDTTEPLYKYESPLLPQFY